MKRYLLTLVAVLLLPAVMFAQGTTSGSIQGTVVDAQGEPLPGANVQAIHQPTGTRYGTATRPNGRYTFNSVRVGGPYIIQVTFVGFNPAKKEIENVELGETVEVDFTLEEGELTLDEISVVAEADPVFNPNRTGAKTNIGREQIDQTPTLTRSLGDYTRLVPQATGGGSFGGANDRYNNLLVDGATLNDVFGLGEGTPGSQAGVSSPISIDAIQEFNVEIAPFEVTNNNFTGGQINAITKSGTNEFSGGAYYQLRNESFVGNYITESGDVSEDVESFEEQYLGLNLGGPIVKDKLFFFVNAEFKRETSPITGGLLGSGQDNSFDVPASTFAEIKSAAQNNYNYNPGTYGNTLNLAQDNNKVLAKLDWNIDQSNKLTFRYNHVDATDEEGISRGSSSYSFSNRQYNFNSSQDSFVGELNSSFGNNKSNMFRAVYTRIRDSRDVVAQAFPEVNVSVQDQNGDYVGVYMGIDRFSQANSLDQDLIEITDNFTYIMGDHEFTIGTSNQIFKFRNLFVQDDFGTYEFRGGNGRTPAENFAAGNPYSYNYSYLLPGGNRAAEFSAIQLGGYVQDKWTVQDNLKLTLGLRVDVPIMPDDPTYNPDVPQAFPGYSTSRVSSGNPLWAPRFGFNWSPETGSELTTQIRGGVGIFSGTPPFVWISNQYSNTGADYGRVDVNDFDVNLGDGFFSPDPNDQPRPGDGSGLPSVQTTEVNLIEQDFKYPQAAKFNLAIDQDLPFGIRGTLEGIYSKLINAVTYRNINLEQVGTSAYGRPIYGDIYYNSWYGTASGNPARVDQRFTNALVLDNTDKGYNYSITAELEKQFDFGLNAKVSYTRNRAENVNNGTSSRAISNWQYNENKDVNDPRIGTADFERRHRILANVSYSFSWAERFRTTFSVIFDGRSGSPYSWIYDGNANGDTRYDNDLMYIPESSDEVVLTSNNWNEFDEWISSESSLNDYRGQVVPRGTAREPWTNYLDLRINQEIKTFAGQKVEVTASMFNVLNFLNNEWGVREYVSFNNYRAVAFEQYVDQGFINGRGSQYNLSSEDIGKPVLNFDPQNVTEDEMFSTSDISSRWQLQIGLRYSF